MAAAQTLSAPTSRSVARTRRFRRLARTGFAVNGLVHISIGVAAIRLAFGDTAELEADPSGTIGRLAATPLGLVVVWAGLISLVALGMWQLTIGSTFDDPRRSRRLWRRLVESGKGLASLALAGTLLVFALGGSTSSSETIRTISTDLLTSPPGIVILVIVGLSVFGSGTGFVAIGIRRGFRTLIRVPAGPPGVLVTVVGAAGYIAKGVALGIPGGLFVAAAITGDAQRATGLDGALRLLDEPPLGTIALSIIGIGLTLYGLFLIARVRLARL